jgi:hypothetical protein
MGGFMLARRRRPTIQSWGEGFLPKQKARAPSKKPRSYVFIIAQLFYPGTTARAVPSA